MRAWWEATAESVLLPVTVLPEITYLLGRRIGAAAELAFVRAVVAGEFAIEPLLDEDASRAADVMGVYHDTPLGFVDASVAAMAERLEIIALLTTDRRHFSLIRPRHASSFQLVP